MDAQRGLSVSGHRNTVLCLHLTSDTYHVTPSGRAPRARGKFWIRRVKLRIFRPDPKSHKSEGFPAAQIFKTHKCQNTYCRSAHFSKAVKFVGAQNPRGTPCTRAAAPCDAPRAGACARAGTERGHGGAGRCASRGAHDYCETVPVVAGVNSHLRCCAMCTFVWRRAMICGVIPT